MIYRPVAADESIAAVRELMSQLAQEEIIPKEIDTYKLDTLLNRETRFISYLGRAAIDKYVEALRRLAPASIDDDMLVPVLGLTTVRKGEGKRRVVLKLDHPQELIKERRRALDITRRLTGNAAPAFSERLDITLGKLNPDIDNSALQERLDQVVPAQVTLLPTVFETE